VCLSTGDGQMGLRRCWVRWKTHSSGVGSRCTLCVWYQGGSCLWHFVCCSGGGQGGVRTVEVCRLEGNSRRDIHPVGSVPGVAPGVRARCSLFCGKADIRMLVMFKVGVSSGCNRLPEVFLGFMMDVVTVRVSSHRANWVLSSSNCARRIYSCARVVLYLPSVRVCWGDCLLLRLALLSQADPIGVVAISRVVVVEDAGSAQLLCEGWVTWRVCSNVDVYCCLCQVWGDLCWVRSSSSVVLVLCAAFSWLSVSWLSCWFLSFSRASVFRSAVALSTLTRPSLS